VRYATPKAPEVLLGTSQGTLETVVVTQSFRGETATLPEALFSNIQLTHGGSPVNGGKLVTQFGYSRNSPEICYGAAAQKTAPDEWEYGLLVTLNSWYMALFTCLMSVSTTVADISANMMLCAALFGDSSQEGLAKELGFLRFVFASAWLLVLCASVLVAWRSALWEWHYKASPRVGDLITNCSAFDRCYTFAALVAFTFFDVQRQVKDIVAMLHPWKSVQPYAAIKCEGHRAYILGYLDAYMFRMENRIGQQMQLLWYILMKTAIFALKGWMLLVFLSAPGKSLVQKLQSSLPLLVSLFSSVVCAGWAWYDFYHLRKDRNHVRRRLLEGLQAAPPNDVFAGQHQQEAARGLLALHFAEKVIEVHPSSRGGLSSPALPTTKTMGLREFRAYLRYQFEKRHRCGECGRSRAAERPVDQPLPATRPDMEMTPRSDTARTVATERTVHFVEPAEICGEESTLRLAPSGTKEVTEVCAEVARPSSRRPSEGSSIPARPSSRRPSEGSSIPARPSSRRPSESSSIPWSATDLSYVTAAEQQTMDVDLHAPIEIPQVCMDSSPCHPCPRQDADDMDSFDMWAVAYGPPDSAWRTPATPTSVWTAETPCLLVPRPSGFDGASPLRSVRGAPLVKEVGCVRATQQESYV